MSNIRTKRVAKGLVAAALMMLTIGLVLPPLLAGTPFTEYLQAQSRILHAGLVTGGFYTDTWTSNNIRHCFCNGEGDRHLAVPWPVYTVCVTYVFTAQHEESLIQSLQVKGEAKVTEGSALLYVRNWDTGSYESVDSFSTTEQVKTKTFTSNPGRFLRNSDKRIELYWYYERPTVGKYLMIDWMQVVINGAVPDPCDPPVITDVQATQLSDTSVRVTWNVAWDSEAQTTWCELRWGTSEPLSQIQTWTDNTVPFQTVFSWDITGLTLGQTYYYRIHAKNDNDFGPEKEQWSPSEMGSHTIYLANPQLKYAWIIIGGPTDLSDSHYRTGTMVGQKLSGHGYQGRIVTIWAENANFETNVLNQLSTVFSTATDDNDLILIYIVSDGAEGYIYFDENTEINPDHRVSYEDMAGALGTNRGNRQVVIVVDACHADTGSAWFEPVANVYIASSQGGGDQGGAGATGYDGKEYRLFSFYFFEDAEVYNWHWYDYNVRMCFSHAESVTESEGGEWNQNPIMTWESPTSVASYIYLG